jgi:hypothetical protein
MENAFNSLEIEIRKAIPKEPSKIISVKGKRKRKEIKYKSKSSSSKAKEK